MSFFYVDISIVLFYDNPNCAIRPQLKKKVRYLRFEKVKTSNWRLGVLTFDTLGKESIPNDPFIRDCCFNARGSYGLLTNELLRERLSLFFSDR